MSRIRKSVTMLPAPKHYFPSWTGRDKNILTFRHPWITDNSKDGIVRNLSLAKLTQQERARVFEQTFELLKLTPTQRKEHSSHYLQPGLEKCYFDPFKLVEVHDMISQGVSQFDHVPFLALGEPKDGGVSVPEYHEELVRLRDQNQQLTAKLEAQTDYLQSVEIKHNLRCTATLGKAADQFQQDFNPKNEPRRRQPVSRVREFANWLGIDTPIRQIRPDKVDEFIDRYNEPATKAGVRANLSSFFRFCKRRLSLHTTPFDLDQLKVRRVPRKPIEAVKSLEDLNMILAAYKDDIWLKSWIAFACLAGPRLSEQLAMETSFFSFDTDPPTVHIPAEKTTECKIPIERKVLLPVLAEFAATWQPHQKFAWAGSQGGQTAKHFFYYRFYRARAEFSLGPKFHALEQEIAATGKTHRRSVAIREFGKIRHDQKVFNYGPQEWRHTFGTMLSLCGYADDAISRMMRNSPGMVAAHYNAIAPTDKRMKDELLWHD